MLTYWTYLDVNRQRRWYLEAANGRKIANSGEGYHNEADCLHAIALVKGSTAAAVRRK
jgi:uncharacterized protein YegP (UPF0339 family)